MGRPGVDNAQSLPQVKVTSVPAGVAEWQTRRIQNPVLARGCGFNSHLRYSFPRRWAVGGGQSGVADEAIGNQRLASPLLIALSPSLSFLRARADCAVNGSPSGVRDLLDRSPFWLFWRPLRPGGKNANHCKVGGGSPGLVSLPGKCQAGNAYGDSAIGRRSAQSPF
jgi:hypothetical protein